MFKAILISKNLYIFVTSIVLFSMVVTVNCKKDAYSMFCVEYRDV